MPDALTPAEAADLQGRHDRLVAAMRARGVEQLVLTTMESLYYLTAATAAPLERPFFLVVDARRERRTLLVPLLERDHLRKAWGPASQSVATYAEYPAPEGARWEDRLAELLRPAFAFEPATPHARATTLLALGGAPAELLEPLRLVKSDHEVARIERAARWAVRGVERVLAAAYEGATVLEGYMVTSTLRRSIMREEPRFDPLSTSVLAAPWPAPLSAEPHAVPDPRMRLGAGPHEALVLTRVNGYAAECERTFFTVRPTAEERRLFAAMLEARRVAFARVRPGVAAAEVDAAADELLTREGLGDPSSRLHRTGHGFGLDNHEPPWLARGSTHVLARNMVVSVEPGIYVPGAGGYRHSDTVLVTDDGYRVLTPMPTGVEALTLRRAGVAKRLRGALVRRLAGG